MKKNVRKRESKVRLRKMGGGGGTIRGNKD